MIIYRKAIETDLEKIFEIWLTGIESTFAGVEKPADLKQQFYSNFSERKDYEFWVAELEDIVIGFQSFLPLSKNPMKTEYMVESSTYIDVGFINIGIGYKLLVYALTELKTTKVHSVIAFIAATNFTTIKIAEKLDFDKIGLVPAMGLNPEKIIYLKPLIYD